MAKGKNRELEAPADLLDEVFDYEALNPALQRVYSELGVGPDGTDVTVHITLIRADGKEARVWSGAPEDYDLMEVARKHGSGDYRVKIYMRVKSGHMTPAAGGNRVFPIQLTPEEDARIKLARENPGALAAPGAVPAMTPETIKAMIAEAVRAVQPAQPDPFTGVKQVAEIVKMLAPQPAPAPVAASPLNGINLGEVIRTVMGMAGEVARMKHNTGGEGVPRRGATSADIFVRLIEKFGEPLLQAAMSNRAQLLGQPDGAVIPAQPGAAIPGNVNANLNPQAAPAGADGGAVADLQMDDVSRQQLKFGINFLIAQADAGHDPVTYADVVADQLDNQPGSPLDRILDLPDPLAFLIQIEPAVAASESRRIWFATLINELNVPDEAPNGPNGVVEPVTH